MWLPKKSVLLTTLSRNLNVSPCGDESSRLRKENSGASVTDCTGESCDSERTGGTVNHRVGTKLTVYELRCQVPTCLGFFPERCKTPSWCRRARSSSWSAAWLQNDPIKDANKAEKSRAGENRRRKDNSQFIRQIGVCGNHRLLLHPPHRSLVGAYYWL